MTKHQHPSKRRRDRRRSRAVLPTPLLLVIGGVLLIAGALFALWMTGRPERPSVPVEVSGSPSLRIDREYVDLGDVPVDELVTVTFNLANAGDRDLRIISKPFVEVVEGC